jgi:hypothetical protein
MHAQLSLHDLQLTTLHVATMHMSQPSKTKRFLPVALARWMVST